MLTTVFGVYGLFFKGVNKGDLVMTRCDLFAFDPYITVTS